MTAAGITGVPVGTVLPTHLDAGGGEFAANRQAMLESLADIELLGAQVLGGGGPHYVERHLGRGKLLARQRLDALVDPGTPVLELSPLAGVETEDPLGGGVVVALGEIARTQCLVIANDPTVRGGTTSPTTIRKLLRAMDVAESNRLPLVILVESGGADLPRQADVFVPGGEQFRRLTQLSAQGIPTICVVFGSSTAGGAYLPGMSDYNIFVEGRARVFLGGPPLVKMAIGEDADEEELGGAAMHARISGLCDYLARDEQEALRMARGVVAHLHWRRLGPDPAGRADEPHYHPDELLGVAPADVRVPFDAREVLARTLDGSRFEEFKALYGAQLVCGWGGLAGYPLGVIANNGILFSEEADKAGQFIQLCNRTDTPILFVQNITGFMVGTRYEQGGIIKDGAKLINAVSNSTVPHLTLMVGASYGAGNYAMAGRAYDPRFVFTWPNHRIAVMGPKQLAGVLSIVRRNAAEATGRPFDEQADEDLRAATEAQIERESTALFATGRLWDDGIIDPRDTRTVLSIALAVTHSAPVRGTARFGVVRH
jgi:acetyl-CoA carboxylase carboxyltransferase component